MAHLVADAEPAAILSSLPGIDVEISLSTPVDGPVWRSVVNDARIAQGFQTHRGRSHELDLFEAGTMSVTLDNRARTYDPEYASSPIADHLTPDRRIRILANWAGTQYVVFDGFSDSISQEYDVSGVEATSTITAADGFKILARQTLPLTTYALLSATDTSSISPINAWLLDEIPGSTVAHDYHSGVDLNTGNLGGAKGAPDFGVAGFSPLTSTACRFTGNNAGVSTAGTYLENTGVRPFGIGLSTASYTGPWTIEAWVNIAAGPGGTAWCIFEYPEGQIIASVLGALNFSYSTTTQSQAGATSAGAYTTGTPFHLAVSRDTSYTSTQWYINGSAVATSTSTGIGAPVNDPQGCRIGLGRNYTTRQFAGDIDSIYLYNQILTSSVISSHYSTGAVSGINEDSGTRLKRVLQYVGWPVGDTDIDIGDATLCGHDTAGREVLAYLQDLAATEEGQFYMGLDGSMSTKDTFNLVWRSRTSLTTATRSTTNQGIFGDSALQYADIKFSFDDVLVMNDIERGRVDGVPQRIADETSIRNHHRRTSSKTGLFFSNDAAALASATRLLAKYKDPALRVTEVTIKPQADPTNLWPQVLGREIGDLITVQLTPQQIGTAISKDLIIEGVAHSFADGEWITTWTVSPHS